MLQKVSLKPSVDVAPIGLQLWAHGLESTRMTEFNRTYLQFFGIKLEETSMGLYYVWVGPLLSMDFVAADFSWVVSMEYV